MNTKKGSFVQRLPAWLSHGIFQGLVVALVASGSLYVYAAVSTWPVEPTIPTGLQPVFVGLSAADDGSLTNGYKDALTKCNAAVAGSHVCTPDEIIHSYNVSVATLSSVAADTQAWVNNGPPGFTASANDCAGWKDSAAASYGAVWVFNSSGGAGYLSSCDNTHAFACCK